MLASEKSAKCNNSNADGINGRHNVTKWLRLKLKVTDLSGNGAIGNAVGGGVYLSSEPQSIVTDIGNCSTGTGSVDGIKIAYELVVNDVTHLIADETTAITISFTFE